MTARPIRESTGRSTFVRRPFDDSSVQASWGIAVETPVEIGINGVPWTLMLATPADLEDLAVGIAHTERAITDVTKVERIDVAEFMDGLAVDLIVPPELVDESARRRRSMDGRTGCGLCGVESLASMPRPDRDAARTQAAPTDDAIGRAFADLPAHQPINRETRSVHAAAWCGDDGRIVVAREDVGRHNALDKVVGARMRGRQSEGGFVVMTSRCSFELVYKAVAAGASLLATISAPTSLALQWSATLGLPLACRGPAGQIVRFGAGSLDGE